MERRTIISRFGLTGEDASGSALAWAAAAIRAPGEQLIVIGVIDMAGSAVRFVTADDDWARLVVEWLVEKIVPGNVIAVAGGHGHVLKLTVRAWLSQLLFHGGLTTVDG